MRRRRSTLSTQERKAAADDREDRTDRHIAVLLTREPVTEGHAEHEGERDSGSVRQYLQRETQREASQQEDAQHEVRQEDDRADAIARDQILEQMGPGAEQRRDDDAECRGQQDSERQIATRKTIDTGVAATDPKGLSIHKLTLAERNATSLNGSCLAIESAGPKQ